MPGAGVVLDEGWVREEERRHGCACRILIVGRVRRHVSAPPAKRARGSRWQQVFEPIKYRTQKLSRRRAARARGEPAPGAQRQGQQRPQLAATHEDDERRARRRSAGRGGEGEQAHGLRGAIADGAPVLAALLRAARGARTSRSPPASRARRQRGRRDRRPDTTDGMYGTMRRSSSFWRSSPRACTSTAVVTTLPVTLDTALVHQPPTTPVIGSLSADAGMARMATRPLGLALHADAELAARCAQRIEEVAERRPLQGVVEAADGNALPQPVAPARLTRRLGVQDDEIDVLVGRGAGQLGELDALLAAARRAEVQQVVLDAAGDEHRLPAHRRHGGGKRRRIDGIDQRRLGLRIEARIRRQRRRAGRLQRQRADARAAERAFELGDGFIEQRALAQLDERGWAARRHTACRCRHRAPAISG